MKSRYGSRGVKGFLFQSRGLLPDTQSFFDSPFDMAGNITVDYFEFMASHAVSAGISQGKFTTVFSRRHPGDFAKLAKKNVKGIETAQ